MTNIAIYGHGPVKVLVLPAWFCSAESWTDTVKWLDPDTYTVAFGDYRGHGSRTNDPPETTTRALAEDMVERVSSLGWERYHVIGHSMGGKVAQLLAAVDTDRVVSIIGVVPVAPGPVALDTDTRTMMSAATDDVTLRGQIFRWSTSDRYSDFIVNKVASDSLSDTSTDAFAAHLKVWADDDITDDVSGNLTPVTILIGEHDNSITRKAMEEALLPHFPNASIETLTATGHYPIFETPVALASVIDRHLRTTPDHPPSI